MKSRENFSEEDIIYTEGKIINYLLEHLYFKSWELDIEDIYKENSILILNCLYNLLQAGIVIIGKPDSEEVARWIINPHFLEDQ